MTSSMSVFAVKAVHTIAFFLLTVSVLYLLYCGLTGRLSRWTWIAMAMVVAEGLALELNDWVCPLTELAEGLGARDGSVAYLFLPSWFATHLFPIYGALFALSLLLLLGRWLVHGR